MLDLNEKEAVDVGAMLSWAVMMVSYQQTTAQCLVFCQGFRTEEH